MIISTYTHNESCKNFYLTNFVGLHDYDFILQTKNEELHEYPNPWDNSLTIGEKIHVIDECIQNPYFFFREVLRYDCGFVDEGLPFQYNKGTVAQIYLHFNKKSSINMCCRQSFKTHTSYGLLMYDFLFKNNYSMLIQEKCLNDSKLGLAHIKKSLHKLPDYILLLTGNKIKDGNSTILENVYAKNRIVVGKSPKENAQSYEACARGICGYDFVEISDMPISDNFKYYYEALLPVIAMKKMLVNINTIDFKNNAIDTLIDGSKRFTDDMFNKYYLMKGHDVFLIHYSYDQLLTNNDIESFRRSLNSYEDENKREEVFKREMCIGRF